MTELSQTQHNTIELDAIWERLYPAVIGVCVAAAWLLWGQRFVLLCMKQHWHIDQMYTAVFAFLAITTGFLASFYCTIVCMSDGFVHRIRDTRKMRGFLAFLKRAIVLGFAVSLASIPMMIVEPAPTEQFSILAFVVALWLGAASWAIAAFYRVASLFFFMFEGTIEPRRPAG